MTVELYLGDCLEVMQELEDNSVDAVITDPPFGIGFDYNGKGDVAKSAIDYWIWLSPKHKEMLRVLRPGGLTALWQANKYFRYFWDWFGDSIRIYAGCKNFVQLRKIPINYGYDPIIMKYLEGEPLRPKKPKRSIDFFVANTAGIVSDTTRIEKGHPCPRPLDQTREIVDNFSLPGGTVLDPFMGSGTTGVACVQTGRNFIGIEIEPKYYKIAEKRIAEAQLQIRMEI